jgi:hypothetical protein
MLRDVGKAFLAVVLAVLGIYVVPEAFSPFFTVIMAPASQVEHVVLPLLSEREDGLYLGLMASLAATFVFWWAIFFIAFRVWRLVRARRSRS